jgi:uncharacterized glyoxalase superfamily protein PhnB
MIRLQGHGCTYAPARGAMQLSIVIRALPVGEENGFLIGSNLHQRHTGDPMSSESPAHAGAGERAEPASFRARSLSISLTVMDLRKSLAWYHEVVGFTVDNRYERDGALRAVALKAGDVRILLNQDDGGKGWDRVKGEGFSVQFTTAQNIDDVATRIREHGGTLESEPSDMPWGVRMFRLRDPDGFRLTISSER